MSAEESHRRIQQRCLFAISLLIFSIVFLCMEGGVIWRCSTKADSLRAKGIHYTTVPRSIKHGAFSATEAQRMTDWSKISEKLCPAMVPQSGRYSRILFDLAQMEILKGSNSSQTAKINCTKLGQQSKKRKGDEFAVRFFEHHEGWETSSHLEPGKTEIYSYLSIWKCANMQIRVFEEQVFPGDTVLFQNRYEKLLGRKKKRMSTIYKNGQKPYSTNQQESRPKNTDKFTDCIVAVVRDPISHFLSGYNEIEWRINIGQKDPRESIAKTWPFGSNQPGSMERFEQFVADLVTCPIGKNLPGIVEKHPKNLEIEHVYSMTAILRLIHQDPYINGTDSVNFHYLPSLANLNELWGPFVLFSCPLAFSDETKAKFVRQMKTDKIHESSDDPLGTYKAAKSAMKEEGPTAKALCALHLMDYACWQDLPDGVPKLCMDLYLDYHKRGLLF